MWESEKKLLNLKYRLVEGDDETDNNFKQRGSTGLDDISEIISLLETTKYHCLQYRIVFLEKIKNVYPKLHNYLKNILSLVVEKIDKAIFEWEENKNFENFLEKVKDIFTIENETVRKNTDSGKTVPVPKFKIVHLSLCIVLLDYLLKTDELTLYNIKSIKPLKKIQTSMKEKLVHVPSKDFNEKTVDQSKIQSYKNYALESTKLFKSLKHCVNEMIDHSKFLIKEVERSHDIITKFSLLGESSQETFNKKDWDTFKYEHGIEYAAEHVLKPLLEYKTGDGTHLSDLKAALENVFSQLQTLKISDDAGSTLLELDETIMSNQEQIDDLKKEETVSEKSEYDVSYFIVYQFPMNMEKLLNKYFESTGISDKNLLKPVVEELSEKLDFCYSERNDDEVRSNHCKQNLEYILGVKLDEKIILYPECKLKECSTTNRRGKCFNGKRLINCKKKKKEKYQIIDDDAAEEQDSM